VGILYGKRDLLEKMPPYQGGGEMIGHVSFGGTSWAELPFKFEAGTPDFVDAAALRTAIDYLESTGIEAVAEHEHALLRHATEQMEKIPGMRIFGTTAGKCALISFVVGDIHPYDLGMLLDKMGVAVRTGHHCAQPLMEHLGIEGCVRASFAMYNTEAEIDSYIKTLQRAVMMLQ
jgi:cysteine desulfurase/selenocysteine lyase